MCVFTQGIAALSSGLGSNGPLDRQKSDADKAGHCPSKWRKRCALIPNILFIKFHLITFEEHSKLVLKRNVFVVFALVADILPDFLDVGLAHRKDAVPTLPIKITEFLVAIAQPIIGTLFQLAYDITDGFGAGHRE